MSGDTGENGGERQVGVVDVEGHCHGSVWSLGARDRPDRQSKVRQWVRFTNSILPGFFQSCRISDHPNTTIINLDTPDIYSQNMWQVFGTGLTGIS